MWYKKGYERNPINKGMSDKSLRKIFYWKKNLSEKFDRFQHTLLQAARSMNVPYKKMANITITTGIKTPDNEFSHLNT